MIDFLPGVRSTVNALNAERVRLEIISQNIANANVTRGPDGKPYVRQQAVFETILDEASQMSGHAQAQGVRVARIENDPRPGQLIYSPGHPDADANGMVAMPNVNIQEEMADLIASSRAYEANLAVLKNARVMAMQTLSIGRRA
ncbi:MAG TPA: flagellar basal body rod protein FlgC [Verrucomicrobiae bacterium]|nr:flagellar basal body rod protein FlgC [Verrucomicrobiae bacterium]